MKVLLFLVLSLCLVVLANPCNLDATAVTRQIVATNGDASGTLKYSWSGTTLTFCVIANQDFCIEEATVWLSSTSTFSNTPTVVSYGCTSDSQTVIPTAVDDTHFRITFTIKKFTAEFPVGIVANSYVLHVPSDWHNSATQKSKSYFRTNTQFVQGGNTYNLFANCVDMFTSIGTTGQVYQPKFYHYLDPNVPDVYKPNFYKINYLINADIKETLLSMHPEGWGYMDIQYAIWDMVHPTSNVYVNYPDPNLNVQRSRDFRKYAEGAPLNWAAGPGDYDTLVAFVQGKQDTMVHVPYDILVAYVEDNLPTVCPKHYTISGVVEGDCQAPCNGVRNPVSSVLPGLPVQLLKNGAVIDTTTSASDGTFTFQVQQPATYEVRLGTLTSALYTSCSVSQVVNPPPDLGTASYPTYVRLSAFPKSSDTNGDSIGDACQTKVSGSVKETCADTCTAAYYQNTPAAGITVQLIDQDSSVVDTTTTLPDGTFLFTNFVYGSYSVKVISSQGQFVCADTQAAVLEPVASYSNRFYIFRTPQDTDNDGFVGSCDRCAGGPETDSDNSGTPDACEIRGIVGTSCIPCGTTGRTNLPIAGVSVELKSGNVVVDTVSTDGNGNYRFSRSTSTGVFVVSVSTSASIFSCTTATVTAGNTAAP